MSDEQLSVLANDLMNRIYPHCVRGWNVKAVKRDVEKFLSELDIRTEPDPEVSDDGDRFRDLEE